MQYIPHIKMLNFSQRPTTTTNPNKKFPTLAEIKEETDPISEEVIFFVTLINTTCRTFALYFPVFQIPKQIPPSSEDDPINLSDGVGSPVRNLPPQAKVSVLCRFVIKNEFVNH